MSDSAKPIIGFIGTGVMGHSMAGHLLDAGYTVNVFNRTRTKTDDLVAKGAVWQESPAAVAKTSEVIITGFERVLDVFGERSASQATGQFIVLGQVFDLRFLRPADRHIPCRDASEKPTILEAVLSHAWLIKPGWRCDILNHPFDALSQKLNETCASW